MAKTNDFVILTGDTSADTESLLELLIFKVLKIDKTSGNEDTPKRISKMLLTELFTSRHITPENELLALEGAGLTKCFDTDSTALVTVTDIPVYSMCEHHWMPFMGKCRVTYKPKGKVIGLSKIPKIVDFYSRKPQLQETLTADVHRAIGLITQSEYVKVELYDVSHLCVEMRGVKKACKTNTTIESGKGMIALGEDNTQPTD